MIEFAEQKVIKKPHAIGLISGGLDSTIAAKVVVDLGVQVTGVYFSMPWGCCDKVKAQYAADFLGIPLIVLQLDERYLEIVKNPRYGYGSAMNPCVDCRSHMFKRAAEYMKAVEADFIFTGEVVGQRPMSQMRHSMRAIENSTGIEGRLLRPLCAQLMEPTIPEKEGLIDRNKLLRLNGRSRRGQMDLAEKFNFTNYPNPTGGCLLTDKKFANRLQDAFKYGYRNFQETIALQWGRHFRINEDFKAAVGRDEGENDLLIHYAHPEDHILVLKGAPGPSVVLKGNNPTPEILALAAGLSQRFSRSKEDAPLDYTCWLAKDKNAVQKITAMIPTEQDIERMKV